MTSIAPRSGGVALFWVIVIACLLAATAGVAARLADGASDALESRMRAGLTARILAPDTPDALERAALQLNGVTGIASVRIVTAERAAQLLRNAGGPELNPSDLPALRLLEFNANRAPDAAWLNTVAAAMRAGGFEAEIYGPGPVMREGAENAGSLAKAALSLCIVLAGAALLTIGLAGRARAAMDRDIIGPLADMGATRGQISTAFAARSAVEAFTAGLVGAFGAATLIFMWVNLPDFPFADWAARIGGADALPLIVAPMLAALLAVAGARAASNRYYEIAARRA